MAKSKPKSAPDAATRILALYGSEYALNREAMGRLRAAMEQEHDRIDVINFDGKSCQAADVLDELRSFGLMQQYKIVVIDEADPFVSANRHLLERYAQSPVDHATLVFQCSRWYKGKLDKLIEKVGVLIKCDPLKSPQVRTRLVQLAKTQHNRNLASAAAQLLIDRLGTSLLTLESELAKLAMLVSEDQAIEPDLIDQVAGRSSDEEAWAIQEVVLAALADPKRGRGQAINKIHELVELSRKSDTQVAYFVADLVRKLHTGLVMKRQGAGDHQIASALKLWGSRQVAFTTAMARLTPHAVDQLFDRIIHYDVRSKRSYGQAMRNIECFCATLADEVP